MHLVNFPRIILKSKAEKASALARYYKYAKKKKGGFYLLSRGVSNTRWKIPDSLWKHVLLTLQMYAAAGRKVGF